MEIGRRSDTTLASPGVAAVACVALLYPVAYTYLYFVVVAKSPQLIQQAVYSGGKVLQFSLPALWVGWLWLRSARNVRPGFWTTVDAAGVRSDAPTWAPGNAVLIGLGFAVLTAAAIGTLTGLWLLPAGYLDVAGRAMRAKLAGFGITTGWQYALVVVFYSVFHSLLEEYYWRWFAFRLVRRFAGLAPAAIVASIAFAAHHLLVLGHFFGWSSPLTWIAAAGVAVGGAFWCWLYERSGRLWIPWLSHMVIDLGVFGMGYWMILGPK